MLRSLILAAAAFVIGYLVFTFFRRRRALDRVVRATDIRAVYETLVRDGVSGSWAALHYHAEDESKDNAVTLRFAIDKGKPGFEWPLSTPRNARDKERFVRLAESRGHTIANHRVDGLECMRVEDGDLPLLCRKVLSMLYQAPTDVRLDLTHEGFSWHSYDAVLSEGEKA